MATVNVSVDFSASPDDVVPLLTSIAMDIRKDPAFSDVFLKDPEILGVDAIKGSEVVYPVVFKTQATKQYGPIREFRRRVRLALEQKGMLPGDPYRTFREFAGASGGQSQLPESVNSSQVAENAARQAAKAPPIDPTAMKAQETNPFTGESS